MVLTNTNSTNLLKGGGLFQLLISYVSRGVLYPSFFTKSVGTAVGIGLYDQPGSGGGLYWHAVGSGGGYLEVNIMLVMFIELMTVCIFYESYIFLYYFCSNVILFFHLFLQAFENDLLELTASLVDNIYLIP